jgi:hypothetical protein
VTGPLAQRCQRPRRRITPNTNTSTTTTISTHNHVDMAVSLGRPRASSRRRYCRPPEQATRSPPGHLPGPDRRPRCAPARGILHPATCPPIWAGRALAGSRHASTPVGPSPSATPRPTVAANSTWEENPGRRQPTPPDHSQLDRGCGEAEKSLPWVVGERCEHGAVETLWQTPRRRCQSDGAHLRRTPNLRPGPLHRPALPVQPRSALRDPPRVGPAAGNSAATPHPKLLGDRWSPPHGGCFNVATCAATGDLHHSAGMPLLTPLGTARTAVLRSVYRAEFLSI